MRIQQLGYLRPQIAPLRSLCATKATWAPLGTFFIVNIYLSMYRAFFLLVFYCWVEPVYSRLNFFGILPSSTLRTFWGGTSKKNHPVVLEATFAWTSDQKAFLVLLLSGQRHVCYSSFFGCCQVRTWLMVNGVPRQVPTVSIPICCRIWPMELILVIMRVREAILATKSGLTMLMFRILQIKVWC